MNAEALDRNVADAESHLSIDLQRVVAQLTLRQRQTLLLVYVTGMTESEAARALGISQPVVCRSVSTALQNMLKMFQVIGIKNGCRGPY